jgi:hypothetical protein
MRRGIDLDDSGRSQDIRLRSGSRFNEFFTWGDVGIFTIAVMEFPAGPVTEMQAPQFPASAQFESESAVPNIPLGRV